MLEPISASLGIAGFGFSLFATCIKGFLLLSSAKNLSKDASTLRCMLHLEEYRLVQWAEKAGLLNKHDGEGGELNERLNKGLIEETLTELATLLTDVDALKRRYNLVVSAEKPGRLAGGGGGGDVVPIDITAPTPGYPNEEGPAGRNRSLFAQAVSPKKRTQILTRAKLLVDGLPKRLWWVVAEKEDFEKMVRQIGFFVQRLVDLLDDQQQEVMRNDIRVLLLNVVAMNDKLEELRAIKTSVEMVVGEDSPIASSAAVKYLRMELEDEAPPAYLGGGLRSPAAPPPYARSPSPGSSGNRGWRSSALRNEIDTPSRPGGGGSPTPINYRKRNPLPTIHPTKITNKSGEGPRPPRETALYNTEDPESPPLPIYIEWKSINKQLRSKIRPRVENLAHLLHTPKHPSFRTLHCRGFFEDYEKAQYGFVFDRPHGADPARNPISLLQLFRLKGFQLPTQTMRMELACILATALSQLHSAGWLHKSLRADNILFFPTTITTPNGGGGAQLANSNKYSIDLTQPYLVGYEYARFDASSEVSEQPSSNPDHDIYRHPLAIGDYSESFNRIFDIYSLGLVFLEIAHWRPLRKIIAPLIPVQSATPRSTTISKKTGARAAAGAGGSMSSMHSIMSSSGSNSSSSSSSSLSAAAAAAAANGGAVHVVPLQQIMKIKEWLLDPNSAENVPGNLAFLVGEIYAGVVQRCLRGDLLLDRVWEEMQMGVNGQVDEEIGGMGYDGGGGGGGDGGVGVEEWEKEQERDPGGEWMLGVEGARISEGFFVKVVRELERCVV